MLKRVVVNGPALFLLCFSMTGCNAASPTDFSCPATLQSTQSASNAPTEWRAADSGSISTLDSVTLLLGSPSDNASQVPDDSVKDGKIESVIWNLPQNSQEEFWIGCTYLNTRIILVKRVPNTAKQCTAKYELLPNGARLKISEITCR